MYNQIIFKMFNKKTFAASLLAIPLMALAQSPADSVQVKKELDEVNVNALRASEKTPMTFTNITEEAIKEQNLGQDLPYLLSTTPSIVTTSDAGAGVGYTGFRVRGSDATRINVTINGIPLNDSESQGVWWVNMPDFASSIENIQIQRGVGSSTNGASAFGATINLKTDGLNRKAYAFTNNTIGSFNTLKNNVEFGTGLINGKFVVDGRLSKISSDGYIDRATSDLKSFYLSGGYYGADEVLKAIVFSGKERTYQAWNGVPLNYLEYDSLRTFNPYTYENEVDNYGQTHYQLHFSKQLDINTNYNVALHYTKGAGYYEQYKSGEAFADYDLMNVMIGDSTISETDLIRRKWLDNDFYGSVFSYNTSVNNMDITLGGAWNTYTGEHFGEIIWAQYASDGALGHVYYDNDATKVDRNAYAKFHYPYSNNIKLYADLQKRFIDYTFIGFDEEGNNVEQTTEFDFFNPKFGFHYQIADNKSAYASFAVANKEPNRNDFVESSPNSRPLHETLYDTELGYKLVGDNFKLGVNGYYMIYENQLVLTGQINDVGAYTRTNIDYSERKGIEIEASYQINEKLNWTGNATFSKNKIANFTEYVDNWDTWGQETMLHENTDISFSPDLIWASTFSYQLCDNMNTQFISKYVGDQYIDNTSSADRMLDAYLVHSGRFSWDIDSKLFSSAKLTFQVNNLLDEKYANNAWVYRFISDGWDPRESDPYVNANNEDGYDMAGYFPQAGRNCLLGITFGF
ncbi:MAG: TonB-dependent receptor [Flavobacteriales bacterium]|nr:TonB-dependent receptor [Flavobacteriales bacterium]